MRPLDGIRILDVTHVLAGPYCGYLLGLLGAEVVKVEHPLEPDIARSAGTRPDLNREGLGTHYLAQGGGKRCIALDLGQATGAAAFLRLVSRFDGGRVLSVSKVALSLRQRRKHARNSLIERD